MPAQEAPYNCIESSPEQSLLEEFPAGLFAQAHEQHVHIDRSPPQPAVAAAFAVQQRNARNLQRNNSFDRDLPILEEDNQFPAFVHLLPVVLPQQAPEPTLDELLRRVTDRDDLQNVEHIRLRVISYTISLSRLSFFLPRLQHLDLSGSVLSSLRDLGYGLIHLTYLNISNCGLNSFDGTSGLPAMSVLIADGNMIQRVDPLAELSLLQRLSVQNNRIRELGLLSFLGMCPNLLEVDLRGNPVCRLTFYQSTLQRSVPTLQLLDGESLQLNTINTSTTNQNVAEATSTDSASMTADESDELSSLSSDLFSNASVHLGDANTTHAQRPGTATVANASGSSPSELCRPSLTMRIGTPVAGSVLGLVRQNRRRNGHAWISSGSSSSHTSTRPPSASSTCSSQSSTFDVQSSHIAFNS